MNKLVLGLFKGRHEMPVEVKGYIFEESVDPTDLSGMAETIHEKLKKCNELILYVTGLTAATLEVAKYCQVNNIALTCKHFNLATGEYFDQVFISKNEKEREEFVRKATYGL